MTDSEQWKEFEGGGCFKIAPLHNGQYEAALYGIRILLDEKGIELTEEEEHSLQCMMIGKYVLLDWDNGVTGVNGSEVVYSPSWATHLLKTNVDFFLWVLREAAKVGGARK